MHTLNWKRKKLKSVCSETDDTNLPLLRGCENTFLCYAVHFQSLRAFAVDVAGSLKYLPDKVKQVIFLTFSWAHVKYNQQLLNSHAYK